WPDSDANGATFCMAMIRRAESRVAGSRSRSPRNAWADTPEPHKGTELTRAHRGSTPRISTSSATNSRKRCGGHDPAVKDNSCRTTRSRLITSAQQGRKRAIPLVEEPLRPLRQHAVRTYRRRSYTDGGTVPPVEEVDANVRRRKNALLHCDAQAIEK